MTKTGSTRNDCLHVTRGFLEAFAENQDEHAVPKPQCGDDEDDQSLNEKPHGEAAEQSIS